MRWSRSHSRTVCRLLDQGHDIPLIFHTLRVRYIYRQNGIAVHGTFGFHINIYHGILSLNVISKCEKTH